MIPSRPRQAVILAGGRGTRLRPVTDTIPKPMVPFNGRPFLGYLLELLESAGFERALLLLGYRADTVVDHFGDRHGRLQLEYAVTEPADQTSRRVRSAAERIDETFLLMYCDNYWPMRFDDMWQAYVRSGRPAQVTVYANDDDYSRDNVRIGADGAVEAFDPSRGMPGLRGVEIGFSILARDPILPLLDDRQPLEAAVYPRLVETGRLGAYVTRHRYYSVGDHRRLPKTEAFLARRPAVLLDRDGVLNRRPLPAEYVTRPEDVVWLPGALEALRRFAEARWRVIVISNQAGVARGAMTKDEVDSVNARMRADAEAAGGRIDAFFYCPHGWDEGCDCRKPRPGLLFEAQRQFDLDLTRTPFIGDDERDAEAARAAGAQPLLVPVDGDLVELAGTLVAEREAVPA